VERIEVLKKLMKEKNMTVADISKTSNLPYTTIKTIMDKGIGKASYINIHLICEALGITTDELEKLSNNTNNLYEENSSKKEPTNEIGSFEWLKQGLIAREVIKESDDLTKEQLKIMLSNMDNLAQAFKQETEK